MSEETCPSVPTGPSKPTIIKFNTQNDRMNEPPPQPRVRKVTTIINTLGVIVKDSATDFIVWVFTACEEKCFPKTNKHMFMSFQVGTWIIVGIYPDGTVASFSPWSLLLNAYETRVYQGQLQMKRLVSELHHEKSESQLTAEFYYISGFGRVLVASTYRQQLEELNDNLSIWVQYCGGVVKDCCWIMYCFDGKNRANSGFTDKELRDIAEFIQDRRLNTDAMTCTNKFVARNMGLLTEINSNKNIMHCWSPHVSMEADHCVKIPQPPRNREIDSPLLQPVIGQWIQFDVQSKDIDEYIEMRPGFRLNISEYLPINSPCGIGVVHVNRIVRVAISCILVKGTDHPKLYHLPLFGIVIDQRMALVSGTHMQLIIEKTTPKIRKSSGICWKVIDSVIVNVTDATVEKIKDMLIEIIPIRDSMESCHLVPIEKSHSSMQSKPFLVQQVIPVGTSSVNSGITSLKYQQPQQHIPYHDSRRDYYIGNSIQLPSNYNPSRNGRYSTKARQWSSMSYTGETMEGNALVEKVNQGLKSGILWFFDHSMSVHFLYDDFKLHVGDYAHVKVEQIADPLSAMGFRWKWKSGSRKTPPFACFVDKNQIYVEDQLVYCGLNRQNWPMYKSSNFPCILDVDGFIVNPTRYHWTIFSLRNTHQLSTDLFIPQSNYQRSFGSRQAKNLPVTEFVKSSTSSDHSTSPPLKSPSLASDE
ncbi:hypothetical protein CRE_15561 [Caenorhabditis remanei]|uniref:Uncharacterized protein n=1 Tax=Caenorhabditis remanei TaxID=31234 RepID=E3MSY6_CAERE|nr:hypothetical protein CRE_15561 [Caenorhabditis remanei]